MHQIHQIAAVALLSLVALPAQNSTHKVRATPSGTAERAGSAVAWRRDFAAAIAEAKRNDRLVFWYLATVPGTPMDRKDEIDHYMRGGPFSWPSTIALLNLRFVAVAATPTAEQQQEYGLERQRFIEPGYLVLDGDGKVRLRMNQVTTLHPQWFEGPLRRLVGAPPLDAIGSPALAAAWTAYRSGDRTAAIAEVERVLANANTKPPLAAEARWLWGAALRRSGDRAGAEAVWSKLAVELPNEPLAWKAALEAEGFGPFTRGFEDFLPLPASVLGDTPIDGSRAQGCYDEGAAWHRAVSFLLTMDDGDGVVRDSIYDFGGTDSLPNVHAAVTCLVGQALLAAAARAERGELVLSTEEQDRLRQFLVRIRDHAADDAWLALEDRDEILWARAYAVRFLQQWQVRRGTGDGDVKPALERGTAALFALQPETGVWFHEYGNPFAIATALQALHAAGQAGVALDRERIDRGLRALAANRTEQGAFTYGHTRRGPPRASLEGAAGRMPLCELALFLFGASDDQRLLTAVETGFRHHDLMGAVRKYDDHADRNGYGGFFFWFDMLGRAEAVMHLADTEARLRWQGLLRQQVLDLAEFDGCFVDSHELGRAYGTAMALLCLDTLAR